MATKNCGHRNFIPSKKDKAYFQTIPLLAEPSAYTKTPSKPMCLALKVKSLNLLVNPLHNNKPFNVFCSKMKTANKKQREMSVFL